MNSVLLTSVPGNCIYIILTAFPTSFSVLYPQIYNILTIIIVTMYIYYIHTHILIMHVCSYTDTHACTHTRLHATYWFHLVLLTYTCDLSWPLGLDSLCTILSSEINSSSFLSKHRPPFTFHQQVDSTDMLKFIGIIYLTLYFLSKSPFLQENYFTFYIENKNWYLSF